MEISCANYLKKREGKLWEVCCGDITFNLLKAAVRFTDHIGQQRRIVSRFKSVSSSTTNRVSTPFRSRRLERLD